MNKITSSLLALTLGAALASRASAQLSIAGGVSGGFSTSPTGPFSTSVSEVASKTTGTASFLPTTSFGLPGPGVGVPPSPTNDLTLGQLGLAAVGGHTGTFASENVYLSVDFNDLKLYDGASLIHDFGAVSLGEFQFTLSAGPAIKASTLTLTGIWNGSIFVAPPPLTGIASVDQTIIAGLFPSLTFNQYTISLSPSLNFAGAVYRLENGYSTTSGTGTGSGSPNPALGNFDVFVNVTSTAVPEPSTYALWGAALILGVVGYRRFSGKSAAVVA